MWIFPIRHGEFENLSNDPLATRIFGWRGQSLHLDGEASHYGYVMAGSAVLRWNHESFALNTGYYFCAPGPCSIEGHGCGAVFSRVGFMGMFTLGGPIESIGRLRYIDGCSDSLLISPPLLGDPCLNMLHIPPFVHQTSHTHPSLRVGIIVQGSGYCDTSNDRIELSPDCIFILPRDHVHSFHTIAQPLQIVVYHPDSDWGPSDESHPMLNRTIIEGHSASSFHVGRT